jgi:hypothetical protein
MAKKTTESDSSNEGPAGIGLSGGSSICVVLTVRRVVGQSCYCRLAELGTLWVRILDFLNEDSVRSFMKHKSLVFSLERAVDLKKHFCQRYGAKLVRSSNGDEESTMKWFGLLGGTRVLVRRGAPTSAM